MNIYDLFAFTNANRGHVHVASTSQDITWPRGRKGMGPTASWEIVGSSQGWQGQWAKPDSSWGFCWGQILGVKEPNLTGWWFGIYIYIYFFFLFHPYLGKIKFNFGFIFSKFGLKPPNLTIPVQNDSVLFSSPESCQIRWKRMCLSCVCEMFLKQLNLTLKKWGIPRIWWSLMTFLITSFSFLKDGTTGGSFYIQTIFQFFFSNCVRQCFCLKQPFFCRFIWSVQE